MKHAELTGLGPDALRRQIGAGRFTGPTAGVTIAGSVTFGTKTPGIGLAIELQRMSVTAVKRLWPFWSIPPARAWFAQRAKGGTLEGGNLTIAIANDALVPVEGRIPPLPDEALVGEMSFTDATLDHITL